MGRRRAALPDRTKVRLQRRIQIFYSRAIGYSAAVQASQTALAATLYTTLVPASGFPAPRKNNLQNPVIWRGKGNASTASAILLRIILWLDLHRARLT